MNETTEADLSGLFTENASIVTISNRIDSTPRNESLTTQRELSSTTLLVAAIYLTTVGFFAILGNITVLTVILRDVKLRSKPHNHLLISLAICDLCVLFGGYPFTIISAYSGEWLFGNAVCTFSGFFTFFLSLTSMNILVAICVFRYVMICLPGKSFLLTPRFTLYVILACFFYGLFWTGLPLLGWGSYALEPFLVSCSLNWAKHDFSNLSYMIATIFFCYIGHVAIMVNCYRHISKTVTLLAQRDRERGRIVREDEMLYRSKVADDQQVTRMCFLVVIVFAGVWTPYALVCAVHIFYHDMPLYMTTLPTLFAKAGCMMNPMVYFLTNRGFRVRALETMGCVRMDNVVGVEMPNSRSHEPCEVVRTFDKLSKDGIYLGQNKVVMERSSTMF